MRPSSQQGPKVGHGTGKSLVVNKSKWVPHFTFSKLHQPQLILQNVTATMYLMVLVLAQKTSLTHFSLHLYTLWKHQKTVGFSDIFRGYWNATLGIYNLTITVFCNQQPMTAYLSRYSSYTVVGIFDFE